MKETSNVTSLGVEKQMTPVERIRMQLDAKIPTTVISKRDGGGGKKLDYLEGWYVINRMNEIFGQGNWLYTTDEMRLVHQGMIESYGKTKHVAHYVAKVTVSALGTVFTDYGYGDGSDSANPGKAHELAVKEAVTDGIKRAAKNFGLSMGLALYDKSRENVDDGESEVESKARARDTGGSKTNKSASGEDTAVTSPPVASNGVESKSDASSSTSASTEVDRKELNAKILGAATVWLKKRLGDAPALKKYLSTTYGVETKEALSNEQASAFLTYLETAINA